MSNSLAARDVDPPFSFDDYQAGCPLVRLLGTLRSRWTVLALLALGRSGGALGYGALRREIRGVTKKMLTDTLRALEHDGLVTRDITPTVPVQVHYGLSPLGRGLFGVLTQMERWAVEHVPQMERLRGRSDELADRAPRPSVIELNTAGWNRSAS